MSQQLVDRIRNARFTPVRLREGYEMGEVDLLLDELADAVTQARPVRPLVAAARFTPVRFREGYDMGEVDDFLAQLARSGPPYADLGASPSSVISEQRGLVSRLFGRRS